MKFIPEKAKAVNGIIASIVLAITVMIVILRTTSNILTKSLMFLLIGILVVVSGLFFAFLKTMYYEIDEESLNIRSVFSFLDVLIPIPEILYYTERITLLDQSGLAGFISKRFSVGTGYIKGMGKVNMYITSSKKTIFIVTKEANYAVSPANMAEFSRLLRKHGVREQVKDRDVLSKDVEESKMKLNQFFLLNTVVILIQVGVPMTLFYLKKLPEYISSKQIGYNMLSYVPTRVYLDRTIRDTVIVFFISVGFYVLSLVYAKYDKIYFYRLMLIPVFIAFLLLLSLSNTLITIFI